MTFDCALAIGAILLALAFDFVNGFHDTANAVATVIYTKALRPSVAIIMSGLLNFAGAVLVGTAVAKVITKIIPQDKITMTIVVAVLVGALIWNILTWYFGLPVSSSHCLIGSLFGAGIAAGGINGVNWSELSKVVLALLISPVAGLTIGAIITWIVVTCTRSAYPGGQQPRFFRWVQVLSSASVSFTHGSNDGQKTMGIITLILATQFAQFGYRYDHVPLWVMIAAAAAMGMGTMIGGWRIIRTVGTKITKERITYAQGFGAELSTATIIYVASLLGAPISTTHTLSSAIAGSTIPSYGIGKLNFRTVQLILAAWILTLPVVALLSGTSYCLANHFTHQTIELATSWNIHL
ncbi:MAG: inorganic phosphate transporter [Candidatus Melainabacteria bacterium]|nr:inorganic phosphate transporter [Candidatus Melainabacteria bacterium]